MTKRQVKNIIKKYAPTVAKKYGVNRNSLAKAMMGIVAVESSFNEKAENDVSTARGLTQILINTQREIEKKHAKLPFAPAMYESSAYPDAPVTTKGNDKMFNADYAIRLGLHYLAYQMKRYGDLFKAVHAYHIGSYQSHKEEGDIYAHNVYSNALDVFKVAKINVPRRVFY